jgi:hypothetical protein
VEARSTGTVAAGNESSNIGIAVLSGSGCTASPFTETGAGTLQVSGQSVSGVLSNSTGGHTITISNATRSGTTISGTATIRQVTHDSNGTAFTTSKAFPFTVNKQ